MKSYLLSAVAIAAFGCGSKTALRLSAADASLDGALETFTLSCGRSTQFTTTNRPITVTASTRDGETILDPVWTLTASPNGSTRQLEPINEVNTTLNPDRLGVYSLRFTGRNARGVTASCTTNIEAIVGPPRALCPEEEVVTRPSVPVVIDGDSFDDVEVVSHRWAVTQSVERSRWSLDAIENTDARFAADLSGNYQLTLTVTDGDGSTNSCIARVRVNGPPRLTCPNNLAFPTRRPATVNVMAEDDLGVTEIRYSFTNRPQGSTAQPTGNNTTATFTPDRRGLYTMRVVAVDADGESDSCDIEITGTPTAPDVFCSEVNTNPLTPTPISARAEDDGTITQIAWRLVTLAPGSNAQPPSPSNQNNTNFTPDLAGEYQLEYSVVDDDGNRAACITRVNSVATEGLRVEVFWNTDGTDIDTHLLRPEGNTWIDGNDCYYANCVNGSLRWGTGGEQNPSLDIDDTNGFGPENINIRRPYNGTYRVGIHGFRGSGSVTVRIYCGGSTTAPRQSFGPTLVRGERTVDDNDFWRVADVTINGASCTITDLSTNGRPNINTHRDARMRR